MLFSKLKVYAWVAFLPFLYELTFIFVLGQTSVKDIYVLGLFPLEGPYAGGQAIQPAVEIAIEYVNKNPNMLRGYRLNLIWDNTKCYAGEGIRILSKRMCEGRTFIMILGAGCSVVSEVVAEAAPLWNLIQVSYSSSSTLLSDSERFPTFFRVTVSENQLNIGRIALLKHFNWTKVATINSSNPLFKMMMSDLEGLLQEQKFNVTKTNTFTDDCSYSVHQLKETDARIIIGAFYENQARLVFCEAFKMRFGGPKVVWLLPGFFNKHWWHSNDTDCTDEEILSTFGNYLAIDVYKKAELDEVDDNGITLKQFYNDYHKKTDYKKLPGFSMVLSGYDTVWSAAHALNATIADLGNTEHGLQDFSYSNTHMRELIQNNMLKVNFSSISGQVSFYENGDFRTDMKFEQMQDGKLVIVGWYRPDATGNKLTWNKSAPFKWVNGKVPQDSVHIVEKSLKVSSPVYITMCSFASFGIILALCFLAFNIRHRSTRVIKMSSPGINNIILMGCIILHSSVFLNGIYVADLPVICMIKDFVMIIGFSLVFGSLFAKTWRVYVIFTSAKKLRGAAPKDFRLYINIGALTALNVSIMIIWSVTAPSQPKRFTVDHLAKEDPVHDARVIPVIWNCVSDYDTYFSVILLAIQLLLLLFGVFLAFTTRKVTIPALNDSKVIGICIYNVIILALVGLPVALLVNDDEDVWYGIISSTLIVGTLSTQCLIFVPKVLLLRQFLAGDETQCSGFTGDQLVPKQLSSSDNDSADVH